MIRNESSIHIYWWMLNELNLSWNDLLVYATIFSFTNGTEDHCYHWSATYLGEWCGLQRRQIMNILKRLEEKWLIIRKERNVNGVKFVDYYTGCVNIAQGDMQKLHVGGCANIAHHNNRAIDNNKVENNSINIYSPWENFDDLNSNLPVAAELEHPQAPVERVDTFWFYDIDDPYVQSMMKNKNFKKNNIDAIDKLIKKGYNQETIGTVLNFIKQDEFWNKQIRSLSKLLKKNSDGVMYIDVMIDKIKQWKPKVIDLDNLY